MTSAVPAVAIIGTGIMASAIAAAFLAGGARVVLLGRHPERTEAALNKARQDAAAIATPGIDEARLHGADLATWNDWTGIDLVIESITEDLARKRQLFADLDTRVPPQIPIGSNSSGYGISEIASGLRSAPRMLNVHFLMPAHLVPLVEVALGEATEHRFAKQACALLRQAGKRPVLLKRDIPGLIAARLQHALMREALALVEAGLVAPDDIDTAVQYGFGFRFAAAGPMMQKEMSGWDTHLTSARAVYPSLANNTEPCTWLAQLVGQGRTGFAANAGFQDWTEASKQAYQAGYAQRLTAALAVLRISGMPAFTPGG